MKQADGEWCYCGWGGPHKLRGPNCRQQIPIPNSSPTTDGRGKLLDLYAEAHYQYRRTALESYFNERERLRAALLAAPAGRRHEPHCASLQHAVCNCDGVQVDPRVCEYCGRETVVIECLRCHKRRPHEEVHHSERATKGETE